MHLGNFVFEVFTPKEICGKKGQKRVIQCDPFKIPQSNFCVVNSYIYTCSFPNNPSKAIAFHSPSPSLSLFRNLPLQWQWRLRCIAERIRRRKPDKLITYPSVFSFREVLLHPNLVLNSFFPSVPPKVLFNSFPFSKFELVFRKLRLAIWYMKHMCWFMYELAWSISHFRKKYGYFCMFVRIRVSMNSFRFLCSCMHKIEPVAIYISLFYSLSAQFAKL